MGLLMDESARRSYDICEPFRERSKIGGSLLSSEGPAFEVYIDAAPRLRVATPFRTDLLKQEGRLEK